MASQRENEDLSRFLVALDNAIPSFIEDGTKLAADQLDAAMQERIFENGIDADGVVLKNGRGYSESYAKYRKKLGRQTEQIDLQLFGDLRKSITVVDSTQGTNIIFNQDYQAEKARGIEKRFNQQIFVPSDIEAEKALDLIEEQFNELINELAKKNNFTL